MATSASRTEAMAAVQKLIEPWSRACVDADWDKLLSMCTDDIVFMPPGAPAVSGEGVRPFLESFPTVRAMSWDVASLEAADDVAFVRGAVRQTLETDEGVQQFDGKYCDLFRRGPDGKWRFAVVMWNADEA